MKKVFKWIGITISAIIALMIMAGIWRYVASLPSTRVDEVENVLTGYKLVGGPDFFEGSCIGDTETSTYIAEMDNYVVTVTSSGNELTAHYDSGNGTTTSQYYPNKGIILKVKADTDPQIYGITLSPCGEKVRSD